MSDYLSPDDYAKFSSAQETTLDGERIWWRGLNHVPEPAQTRIRGVIRDDCAAFERLGYDVDTKTAGNGNNIDVHVRHPEGRQITHSDSALLKGSAGATRGRAGWGGGS